MITAPRTVQDTVDHGDELAKRFEDYEPRPGDERSAETFTVLRRAVWSGPRPKKGFRKPFHVPVVAGTPAVLSAR